MFPVLLDHKAELMQILPLDESHPEIELLCYNINPSEIISGREKCWNMSRCRNSNIVFIAQTCKRGVKTQQFMMSSYGLPEDRLVIRLFVCFLRLQAVLSLTIPAFSSGLYQT